MTVEVQTKIEPVGTLDFLNSIVPIYIEKNLQSLTQVLKETLTDEVCVITQPLIKKHYYPVIEEAVVAKKHAVYEIEDGESAKSLQSFDNVIHFLLKEGFTKNLTLIAFGGGVVGDLTGFVASTYLRGVSYIQIPTTLMAQADAAIGAKTALNHPLGKNMIGSFYPPMAILSGLNTLNTLPVRHLNCGLAEIIKMALISDEKMFNKLLNTPVGLSDRDLFSLVRFATLEKVKIVNQDPYDTGLRRLLNLGHTFAHAIEAASEYQIYHGEALSIGLMMALTLSIKVCGLKKAVHTQLRQLLLRFNLPVQLPNDLLKEQILIYLMRDKKKSTNDLTFILLKAPGQAIISSSVSLQLINDVIGAHLRSEI